MCALVLALRKIPIYAPGGGGATLGSSDMPSYSVSVSDAEAASNRDAFAKTKEAKRLIPSKDLEASPATSTSTKTDQSSESTLRNRSATANSSLPKSESAALTALNARDPTSDPAHDWENEPKGNSPTSPTEAERRRSNDIEEVRDVLRRASTRGKRKDGETLSPMRRQPGVPTIAEPMSRTGGNDMLRHDYMSTAGSVMQQIPEQEQYSSPPQSPDGPDRRSNNPFRPLQSQAQQNSPPYGPLPQLPLQETSHQPKQQQTRRQVPAGNNSFAQARSERNDPFA